MREGGREGGRGEEGGKREEGEHVIKYSARNKILCK